MVVRIEREVGDDSVQLFLFLVEERKGQKEVVFPAWVMELFVASLVALLAFFCTYTAPLGLLKGGLNNAAAVYGND